MIRTLLASVVLCVLALPAAASADASAGAAERGRLAREFVLKWGPYVQVVQGRDIRAWADGLVPLFARGDAANLRRALGRATLEGAVLELHGRGGAVSDEAVIDELARASLAQPQGGTAAAKALGSLTEDLVFTPVVPCRLVDTRVAGGVIPAGGQRSFRGQARAAHPDFSAQGGSATDCGLESPGAGALALNVTVVQPANVGFATVYAYDTARPLAAALTYPPAGLISNAVLVAVPSPVQDFDFTLYTSAPAHYVVDVVGYFSPPKATLLDCYKTNSTGEFINPGATGNVSSPACDAGYLAISVGCGSSSIDMPLRRQDPASGALNAGTCIATNRGASSAVLEAYSICCRLPGR